MSERERERERGGGVPSLVTKFAMYTTSDCLVHKFYTNNRHFFVVHTYSCNKFKQCMLTSC